MRVSGVGSMDGMLLTLLLPAMIIWINVRDDSDLQEGEETPCRIGRCSAELNAVQRKGPVYSMSAPSCKNPLQRGC